MNREEANKDELIFIKGVGYFHPDLLGIKMGDTGKCVEKDNNVPVKQPDPTTGLVPCGCGGAAHFWGSSGDESFYLVECEKCEIETVYCSTKKKAREAWNTAMSGGMCNHEN